MAPKGSKSEKEKEINKQFILAHLDEKEIDLSMCNLSQVPVNELAMVTRGSRLDLSRNLFTTLPDSFGTLRHLIELDLSSNQLKLLPDTISHLVVLQKLDLYSNKLSTLPLTFWKLKKLKWLDLRSNCLEGGLSEVAGPCVSQAECKQCASKVLVFVKQRSAEHERKRQLELLQKREEEQMAAEKEQMRQEEARKAKAELRQRRREEYAKSKQERARQEVQNDQEEAALVKNEANVGKQVKFNNSETRHCSYVRLMLVGVVLFLLLLLVGSYVYCDHLKSPTQVCSYWRENISGASLKNKWTEQLMQFIGLS